MNSSKFFVDRADCEGGLAACERVFMLVVEQFEQLERGIEDIGF